jgi:effector-binding domain-containing protein
LVNNLHEWKKWSPWHQLDTAAQWTFSGEQADGAGAWYTWRSNNPDVGNGKLTILESREASYIKTQLNFEDMAPAYAEYFFTPDDSGVVVKWTLDSDMGMNPIGRYFGLFMDKLIGKDYEQGLLNLKREAEFATAPAVSNILGFAVEMRQMPATTIAGIREVVKFNELTSDKFGKWFMTIGTTLSMQKMQPIGPPMTVYYTYEKGTADMEAAMPVAQAGKNEGAVTFHELPPSDVMVVKYYGDYSKTEPVYYAAFDYIRKNGLEPNGFPMEVYVTDPMMEKDTAKWLTEIIFPVK